MNDQEGFVNLGGAELDDWAKVAIQVAGALKQAHAENGPTFTASLATTVRTLNHILDCQAIIMAQNREILAILGQKSSE